MTPTIRPPGTASLSNRYRPASPGGRPRHGTPRWFEDIAARLPSRYGQPMLEFAILGPLEVVGDGRSLALGGPKQRGTLAILLLNANRVVSVERVADDVYAGRPPVTAVTQVQRQISELRRVLGPESGIETQPPGYRIRIEPKGLDLLRFERLTAEGATALDRGDAEHARSLLGSALGLWRGEPLADLARQSFAPIAIERLDEMRLAALEMRLEADLACGRHVELTAELDELAASHPYRETFHSQRMLALYRSGRQVEALAAFRSARDALSGGLGLEPGPALRELERAILVHDPTLGLDRSAARQRHGAVLALPRSDARVETIVQFASSVVDGGTSELVVARLLARADELPDALGALRPARATARGVCRTAAFTSEAPVDDVVRLVTSNDVALVVVDASDDTEDPVSGWIADLLDRSPVDVAVVARVGSSSGAGVVIPFGGGEHDWAALELGARIASANGESLSLVGTSANPTRGRRDASGLLADASLAVQRLLGIETDVLLLEPSVEALLAITESARVVALGLPARWRAAGIGTMREALVRRARCDTALVHRGPRPGALAPRGSRTSFTWTIEG